MYNTDTDSWLVPDSVNKIPSDRSYHEHSKYHMKYCMKKKIYPIKVVCFCCFCLILLLKKFKKIDKSMYDCQWPTCRYFVLLLPVTFLPFTYSASSAQYFRLIIFWVIFLVFTLQRVQGDQYPSLYHRRAHTINNPISVFNFYKAYFYTWHANTDTATVNIFIRIYYQFRFRW